MASQTGQFCEYYILINYYFLTHMHNIYHFIVSEGTTLELCLPSFRVQNCSQSFHGLTLHSRAEGSSPLASQPSAYRLQDISLCLQCQPWSRSVISQMHLQS